MIEQRPGQKIFVIPGPAWGVRVVQPAAPPADWWDPDNEGLSVVGAYRAINSVGTTWPGGPANYAESLVNQANPGVNDLTEGNGAVPWAAATGWGFVAAAAQYFDTGLIAQDGWTFLIQYANCANNGSLGMLENVGMSIRLFLRPDQGGTMVRYTSGGTVTIAPRHLAGNLGVAGQQGYRDGAADGPAIPAWGGVSTYFMFIGALNMNVAGVPTPWDFMTVDMYAAALYDATLTAPQVLAVATAMAAL